MINVEGLSHAYNGDELILKGVTFAVKTGEKVVLLGTNGCGKSSLLRILNGLISPREGHIDYKGETFTPALLKDASFNRRFRREVVLLFQNPDAMLFNPTVYDEIAFGLRQLGIDSADERVQYWADQFDLTRYLDRVPFQLSRGESKRCVSRRFSPSSPNFFFSTSRRRISTLGAPGGLSITSRT